MFAVSNLTQIMALCILTLQTFCSTAKEPVQKGRAPKHQAPMTSPGNSKIISVTEEVVETVETKPGSKRTRHHIDDISAPEYFTKGLFVP